MGIDKMSIAANYHNQAVQATQINTVKLFLHDFEIEERSKYQGTQRYTESN